MSWTEGGSEYQTLCVISVLFDPLHGSCLEMPCWGREMLLAPSERWGEHMQPPTNNDGVSDARSERQRLGDDLFSLQRTPIGIARNHAP